MMPMVAYRSEKDASLWFRPVSEFEDGRFEPLPPAPMIPSKGDAGEALATHETASGDRQRSLSIMSDQQAAIGEDVARGLVEAAQNVFDTLNGGFVRCEGCGDQEDTTNLDFVPELGLALAAYRAHSTAAVREEPSRLVADAEVRALEAAAEIADELRSDGAALNEPPAPGVADP